MLGSRSLPATLVFICALTGCSRDNPAFDDRLGDESGVGTGAETGVSGDEVATLDTSAEGPTSGDGDTGDGDGDAGDGDADTGDGDTGAEADPMDLPGPLCSLETGPPLQPIFGDPFYLDGFECPVDNEQLVKVFGVSGPNYMVGICAGGCEDCNSEQLHPLGALGLSIVDQLPTGVNDPDPLAGCFRIETEELVNDNNDICHYSSLGVFSPEDDPQGPLFAAVRDDWGLTPGGTASLGNFFPDIIETGACGCDELDPEVPDCCPQADEAATFKFEIGATIVYPGETKPVQIDQTPFDFHAVQGQQGFDCEVDFEISWALSLPG